MRYCSNNNFLDVKFLRLIMEEKYSTNYYTCYNTLKYLQLNKCAKCKPAGFCSAKCQAIRWLNHKQKCGAMSDCCIMTKIDQNGKCEILSLINITNKNFYDYGIDPCILYNLNAIISTKIVFSNGKFLEHIKIIAYHCFLKKGFVAMDILNHRDGEHIYLCCIYCLPAKIKNPKNLQIVSAYDHHNTPEEVPMITMFHLFSAENCKQAYKSHKKLYNTKKVAEYGIFLKVSKDICEFVCYDEPM